MGIALCLFFFIICYAAGRRSLVSGLGVVLTLGYFYGILRANIPERASHFYFDSGVLGLYFAQLPKSTIIRPGYRQLFFWVLILIVWPTMLLALPGQDPLIRIVGLRGNIFFLPFLLLGARLETDDIYPLALWFCILNMLAFGIAFAEYYTDLRLFYPVNEVTQLIYARRDVAGYTAFRIPGTFANSYAYAGAVNATIPFIIGALVDRVPRRIRKWDVPILIAGAMAGVLGEFMTGSRAHMVVLFAIVVTMVLTGKVTAGRRIIILAAIVVVGYFVNQNTRLQRFTSLGDTEYVSTRVSWSVNARFFDFAVGNPFGVGLGGGGTSIPYFLASRTVTPYALENDYARMMLEEGIPGLVLFLGFLAWAMLRWPSKRYEHWRQARRLTWVGAAAYFASGMIGLGLMTAIPETSLIFMGVGWIVVRERPFIQAPRAEYSPSERLPTPWLDRPQRHA